MFISKYSNFKARRSLNGGCSAGETSIHTLHTVGIPRGHLVVIWNLIYSHLLSITLTFPPVFPATISELWFFLKTWFPYISFIDDKNSAFLSWICCVRLWTCVKPLFEVFLEVSFKACERFEGSGLIDAHDHSDRFWMGICLNEFKLGSSQVTQTRWYCLPEAEVTNHEDKSQVFIVENLPFQQLTIWPNVYLFWKW